MAGRKENIVKSFYVLPRQGLHYAAFVSIHDTIGFATVLYLARTQGTLSLLLR